jgi:glycosyltransferase involved in cell wall biosynthesis
MHVTVAICTWNRCDLLEQTLRRLTEVVVPPHVTRDVVVVNNNCTDRTSEVALAFQHALRLRLVFESTPGLSNARNRALIEARGDYIAWIDDDVLVDRQWLVSLADAAGRRPDVHALGGPIDPWFPVDPDPVLVAAFPALAKGFCGLDYGAEEILLRANQPIFGANMVYALRPTAGMRFDPTLGPNAGAELGADDTDFCSRVRSRGGAVLWVPGLRVQHYVDPSRMTLKYLTKFSYDRGRSMTRQGPGYDGPRLMGAPRWMWRAIAQHYASYAALRFTPFRRQALERLREYQCTRGMLAESLVRARAEIRPGAE